MWIPAPGDLVADTARGTVGTAVAWDGHRLEVTLKPFGAGELWRTSEYRKGTDGDRARARNLLLTHEQRGW